MKISCKRKSGIPMLPASSRLLRFYVILILLTGCIQTMYAQENKTITGKITDKTGEAIIGVNVSIEGTTIGATTDTDGNYSLSIPQNTLKLTFSFIGYNTLSEKVTGKNVLNVVLEENVQALDEVVVVGYGIQKKVNLTGSVASIGSKELESRPLMNLSSGLGGLLPGVQITQSTGKPGGDGATINIRGLGTLNNSSPLIIIDGIEGDMNSINPTDVESVNILKDAASSAIYGARAANGVVLITTKKGSNEKTSISFSSTWSIAQPTGIFDYENDYLTYMNHMNTASTNTGAAPLFYENDIKKWEYANAHPNELNEYGYPLSVAYPNTDWLDVMMKSQLAQNYNLSASGGSEKITYNISLGYLNNPGIMANSGMERFNGRINLEGKITKFLTVGTQTWFTKQNTKLGDTGGAISTLRSTSPSVYPQFNDKYGATSADGENQQTNNALCNLESAAGGDCRNRFVTTWYAKINIIKGLNFETKFNYTYANQEKNNFGLQVERWNFAKNQLVSPAANLDDKTSSFSYDRNKTLTIENLLRYNTTIAGKHNLSVLLGHNEFSYHTYNFSAVGRGMSDISLPNLDSMREPQSVGGKESNNMMRSFFGRINYDYQNKYLLEINVRNDGSSRFAEGNRWSTFPSFSGAWRLDQEEFMPENFRNFFQNFKIRGSWGKLGNNSIDPYLFMNKYVQDESGYYSFGGVAAPGLIVKNLGNASLKWESTRVWGGALETNFLNQRMALSVEYYDKYTNGILYKPTMNGIMGNKNAPMMNLAEVSNKGFEINLGWNDRVRNFNYSIAANISYNKNNVEKYRGKLVEGWEVNADGKNVWTTNFGSVANGSDNVILEGHSINEHRVTSLYKGKGDYYNTDGSVNINGGPKDGMVRTEKDMEWVKSMISAGYSFQGVSAATVDKKNGLYYGDLIYADLNGDGKYGDPNTDRRYTGTSKTPKWNLGMSLSADYKGFDLSMVWLGLFGAQVWGSEAATNNNVLLHGGRIPEKIVADSYFFDPSNPNDPRTNIQAHYPRLKTAADALNVTRSDFWLTNASFLRLKNIQVGYTLPRNITNKMLIKNLRVFVSGENLLTISSFNGMDPESQLINGYPTLKQFAFGLNVNF